MTLVMPKFWRLLGVAIQYIETKKWTVYAVADPTFLDAYILAIIATASPRSSSLDCRLVLVIAALCALLRSV